MKNFQPIVTTALLVIILLVAGCGGSEPEPAAQPTEPPPTATAPAPTDTPEPPTPTPEPPTPEPPTSTPEPTATPTPEVTLEKVSLEFQTTVPSIEDAERVLRLLEEEPGIKDGIASEVSLDIRYDPELITLEEIRSFIESKGFPLKEE